jgi:uncharacterized protein DUF5916/cellulose/xylan binding protein with CBM9 domain
MSKIVRRVGIEVCVLVAIAMSPAASQTVAMTGVTSPPAARYVVIATRLRAALAIDGRLTDPAWTNAPVAADLTQQSPEPGRPASQRTESRVLVDGDAVYVAMRLHDSAPDSIVATLARRDYTGYSDWAHLIIDSFHDRRTAFHFAVNPAGVKRDGFISGDQEWSEDYGWDAVWDVATRRDSAGWTAEFRIPLSQLRFAGGNGTDDGAVWGIEFARDVARRGERSYWAPIPPDAGTYVSNFGTLTGVPVREAKRRLEIAPYAVARTQRSKVDLGNPLHSAAAHSASAGADFKVGLTSDITVTGTVNPDFGQVEADPSQVNLSGAEILFSERRPFFIEGLDLFQYNLSWGDWMFGNEQLFYTRRIGRTPQLDFPDSAQNTSTTDLTRLLAAGKLSGQSGRWRIGALSATTAEETGRFTHTSGVARQVLEPLTHYGVFRLGRTFGEGHSQIAFVGTTTNRRLEQASVDVLHSSAYAGGLEGRYRFGGGNYGLAGYLFGTSVAGSPAAIARTQTSFHHLFQRDPAQLGLDSSATSLTGLASEVRFSKNGGGRSRAGLSAHVVTRGFDVNDLGFITRSNFASTTGWIGRSRSDPTKHTRLWHSFANYWALWGLSGPEQIAGINWWNRVQLQNYWELMGAVEYHLRGTSISTLRGGPAMRTPTRVTASYMLRTDQRRRANWLFELNGSPRSADGSWMASFGPGLTLRPVDRAEVQLQPSLEWRRTGVQFIDDPATAGGPRYLVGDLRQRTASLTGRASVAFTPTLTVQAYAQPFLSNGRFVRAGEVVNPMAPRVADRVRFFDPSEAETTVDHDEVTYRTSGGRVTLDNPDFSITNLNANVVLRWEYRAGSTVYAVWSQGRSEDGHDGSAGLRTLNRDLWRAPATNVLLVKWAHYIGR